MKAIKTLTADEWYIIFMVVNNPPGSLSRMPKEESNKRRPLMNKIIEESEINLPAVSFKAAEGKDLLLDDACYINLLSCLEETEYPTMMDDRNGLKVKKKVLSAETVK